MAGKKHDLFLRQDLSRSQLCKYRRQSIRQALGGSLYGVWRGADLFCDLEVVEPALTNEVGQCGATSVVKVEPGAWVVIQPECL